MGNDISSAEGVTCTAGVAGVLLAGGRSRRFGGGDKCLRAFGGGTLLGEAIARLGPQVSPLVISANGDPARFARFGLPVVADGSCDFSGPLAGILAGMEWAAAHAPASRWVVSVPGDTPFIPHDLVARLHASVGGGAADAACVASGGRLHPVIGLWAVALAPALRRAMHSEGLRRAGVWAERCRLAVVEYPAEPVDPFFNINRPEDLRRAERLVVPAA